jgi:hypothetical protein
VPHALARAISMKIDHTSYFKPSKINQKRLALYKNQAILAALDLLEITPAVQFESFYF